MVSKAFILILGLLSIAGISDAVMRGGAGGSDYCDSLSWTTTISSPNFSLDIDHTTDEKTACTATDEVGVFETGTTSTTPATTNPGSGGDAVLIDGNDENLYFDNADAYFDSEQGEISVLLNMQDGSSQQLGIFYAEGVASQDRLFISKTTTGMIQFNWEDNNDGLKQMNIVDIDSTYIGDWVQVNIRWDTTRCSDGAGDTCADAGEDELCSRYRIDANQDGDFGDGGVETWSSWSCESSTYNYKVWTVEPGTNDIHVGHWSAYGSTNDAVIWIDDVEIKATASW